ncbi:MAG: ATP-binding cassette domain-containing protein [Dehalococcoidales bacterium]|jgi:putative ABC transport system ATP-binding protein|nr:ATP-binding cassette domain-containing protein [Dehalococcoidales bacterium]MDP7109917.1 ATP-binding cassette domain-containing protein [Dehalococcoidales bacterium]MDP7309800.1 ATP-binding cassette domain-containing protein [Dehalococcoidales bacterium]MDP7409794.1 ATP-binding cassette domain-containing protein [Dehalococcoidales bacterium]MDP7676111.1 ATP-binding cassette domain-containing protein [Dehalococcoidales bacterium]|tara:strand:- start:739 stop:1587 length:849 start_codon:yes stop_codon:yes gene_type:complete
MSEIQSLLLLKKVDKEFGIGTIDRVKALDNINLSINEHDSITVIGSNGAGKTTLLNIIAGVYPPERGGNIIINNMDITNLVEHKRSQYFGRVYQDPHIGTAAKMTIGENLSLAIARGRSRGLRVATTKKRLTYFQEILATLQLGLEDRLNTLVGTLSGGQRQALALVMATISRPALLLLDEHTAKLDPNTAGIVLKLTEDIVSSENITVLMVTHNMEHALRYGNRLLMMHKGKIIVDLNHEQRSGITVNDLLTAFERASGEQLTDDSILLNRKGTSDNDEVG